MKMFKFECDAGLEFIPRRATINSAGYDFYATEDIHIKAGEWTKIDTHVRIVPYAETPDVLLLMPRSSYGMKYGFRLRNTIGVIDQDFPDHISATVTADEDITIKKGDKYMQGIVVKYDTALNEIKPVATRTGGVGSTGH